MYRPSPLIQPGEPICSTADLRNGESVKFRFSSETGTLEAFLILHRNRYHAYVNRCRHLGTPLDYDDNDFFSRDGERLVCKTHGAQYLPDSGACAGGPCDGGSLKAVPIEVSESQIILARRDVTIQNRK